MTKNQPAPRVVTGDAEIEVTEKWDPTFTDKVIGMLRPVLKRYFRSEVRGLENLPTGGSLLVSNHSGGTITMDVPIFAIDYYDQCGYDRPVFTLTHDVALSGPTRNFFIRLGFIPANRETAARALRTDGLVVVFPGGDHDVHRPTTSRNVIDFNGRVGYVRAALEAGVPITPMVSIGGQETHLFLTRGKGLAKRLGPISRILRAEVVPISFGFPFGLSISLLPPNLPLPSKVITRVLEPIDITATFGEDPDLAVVDEHVRTVMQKALDELGSQRRFPVLG